MPVAHDDKLLLRAANLLRLGRSRADVAQSTGLTKKAISRLQDRGRLPRSGVASGCAEFRELERSRAEDRYRKMQRYIDEHKPTRSELAQKYGVTRQRIYALEKEGRISIGAQRG